MLRPNMKSVSLFVFKESCVSLLEEVSTSGKPLLVTRDGEPMVFISVPPATKNARTLGRWEGKVKIVGDIVAPTE